VTVSDTPIEPAPVSRRPVSHEPSPGSQLVGALVSSALLAAWIAWQMGWVWAVAGVFGILVHELGHLALINALGCGPGRIQFIPFLGGAATMRTAPDTEFKGVLISLAGPGVGLLATIPFFLLAHATGGAGWLGGAFFIALINLVNLAPAPPLDGSKALGPALARIHPRVERAALLIVGVLAIAWALDTQNYIFGVFVALGTFGALRRGAIRPPATRLSLIEWVAAIALWLIALALCLAVMALASAGADPMTSLHRWGL
jgi:Zn-dependent protease